MYHQIMEAENNQDALRLIWRNNTDEDFMGYMMKVHIFGKIDSPCIASWVIKRIPSDQSSQYENEIIETFTPYNYRNFYMDDY